MTVVSELTSQVWRRCGLPGSGGSSQQFLSEPPGHIAEGGPIAEGGSSVAAGAFAARAKRGGAVRCQRDSQQPSLC